MTLSADQELYEKISRVLLDHAPRESTKVIARFEVIAGPDDPDGTVYGYEYDYIDRSGNKQWFEIKNGREQSRLGDYFRQLREFFASQGQPSWQQCEFQLDVEGQKFKVDFKYK